MRRSILLVVFILLSIILIGCGTSGRDAKTPSKAVLGHWRERGDSSEDYYSEQYYSPNKCIIVLPNLSKPNSSTSEYIIVSEDKQAQEITIRVRSEGDAAYGNPFVLRFNNNAMEMEYEDPLGFWVYMVYVDSKQAP